jgi:hypothetical protein
MGTGGNFEDELDLVVDPITKQVHVDANGPAYGEVVELCVWIIQKQSGGDAAATQITTYPGRGGVETGEKKLADGTSQKTWRLRALQASTQPLEPGFATAMAIALFREDGKEQAQLWAQAVDLVMPPPAPEQTPQTSSTDADDD